MLKFFKFFLAILSLIIWVFLVNLSFFSWNQKQENKLSFLETQTIKQNKTQKIKLASWSKLAYKTKINFFDSIFHKKENNFKVENKSNTIEIILEPWIFILDLNDLSKTYKITSKQAKFDIDLKAIWSLYIDSYWDKVTIFSINSSLVLNFLNSKLEKMNSYFMYPHEFIKFKHKLNFMFKNVDLYRIRTITQNWYFKHRLIKDLETEKEIESLIWRNNIDFFEYYIKNKIKQSTNNKTLYEKINSLKKSVFPFSYYIDKYSYYFVNKSKKISYLQNNIYNNVIKLLSLDEINAILVNDIKIDLEKLKILDEQKYNKSIYLIDNFYKITSLKNNIESNYKLSNFILLKSKNKNLKILENYLNLKNIYFHLDFLQLEQIEWKLNLFLDSYISKSWIKQQNENFTLNKKEKLKEIESFVFFLSKYIESNLFSWNLETISSQTWILSKYTNLNKMIYFSWKTDEKKIRTSLSKNLKILQNLENFLRSNFFEQERQLDTELLVPKEIKVNFEDIDELKKEVRNIFDIFEKNISILEKFWSDKTIKQYQEIWKLLEEEFFAIYNYDKYSLENNKKLKELYNISIIWEQDSKDYDEKYIFDYLSSFEQVSVKLKNITKNWNIFSIKNSFILWKIYNMELNPSLWNIIKITNKTTNLSYDLDNMKFMLEKKYESASEQDKYKYEFKNFFVQRFKNIESNWKNDPWEDICYFQNKISDWQWWCKDIVNDNSAITVIKRDKLILGEFKSIKDFFTVEYEDLSVSIEGPLVDIKILKSNIQTNINKNWKEEKYSLEFSSSYDLENHEFSNISFKIRDVKNKNYYLYSWAKFILENKKIKINNLKNSIDSFLKSMKTIDYIHSSLRQGFILAQLEITYKGREIYLKFENRLKTISMILEADKIKSITINQKEILENNIDISELSTILDKLK